MKFHRTKENNFIHLEKDGISVIFRRAPQSASSLPMRNDEIAIEALLNELDSLKCCGNCKHEAYDYDFFECPHRVRCSRCCFAYDFDGKKEDFWEKT